MSNWSLTKRITVENTIFFILMVFGLGVTWGMLTLRVESLEQAVEIQAEALKTEKEFVEGLKESATKLHKDVAVIQISQKNTEKSLDEVKSDVKEVLKELRSN